MATFNVIGFAGPDRKNKPRHDATQRDEAHLRTWSTELLEVKQNVQVDYNIGDVLEVVSGPFVGNKT